MKEENKKSSRSTTKKVVIGVICGFALGALAYSQKERILTYTMKGGKFIVNGIKSAFTKKSADKIVENN